jgi:ATP-dependent Clp protease ATP-binding subunit ClpC
MLPKKKDKICDICGVRPAIMNALVIQNGLQTILELCELDYMALDFLQKKSYGMGDYSSNDPLSELFDDSLDDEDVLPVTNISYVATQSKEFFELDKRMSDELKQIVIDSGDVALSYRKSVIDVEHLLYALLSDEIVVLLLDLIGVDKVEVRNAIDKSAEKREQYVFTTNPLKLPLSDTSVEVLQNALVNAKEYNSQKIEPEHVLMAVSEDPQSLAGSLLRGYGITAVALRRPELRVLR